MRKLLSLVMTIGLVLGVSGVGRAEDWVLWLKIENGSSTIFSRLYAGGDTDDPDSYLKSYCEETREFHAKVTANIFGTGRNQTCVIKQGSSITTFFIKPVSFVPKGGNIWWWDRTPQNESQLWKVDVKYCKGKVQERESTFDAYSSSFYKVNIIGTVTARFAFGKCMGERGWDLESSGER